MKAKVLICLLAFMPLITQAAYYYDYKIDPCREAAGVRYNLAPLFYYWSTDQKKTHQIRPPLLQGWDLHRFKVHEVLPDGLLVTIENVWPVDSRTYILRHHPRQAKLVDTDLTEVVAIKLPNRAQYTTTGGSTATVEQFDYGIPCK